MVHKTSSAYYLLLAVVDHSSSGDQGALVCDVLIVMGVQTGATTGQDRRGSTRDHLVLVGINYIF